jgi:hypothetical protein
MHRFIKFGVLAVCCSIAAYGLGRVLEIQASPAGGQPMSTRGEAPAGAVARSSGFPKVNAAQQALLMHISHVGNVQLDHVKDQPTRDRIIVAMNVLSMNVLDGAQQKQNLAWIQLEQYRPGAGPWDRVRNAETKIKALLTLSPDQIQRIDKFSSAEATERQKEFADLKGMPRDKANEEMRRRMARKTREEHQADWSAMLKRGQDFIVKQLTPAQRKEWDTIMSLTEREYKSAAGAP